MTFSKKIAMLAYLLQALGLTLATQPQCKAIPGRNSWPSDAEWSNLNQSISGRLLKPAPPAAACHSDQPQYNLTACAAINASWALNTFHAADPISSMENNWNNDSCLPNTADPCSGKGYPVYVVNATCVDDVKKGVDFARNNNVRLIVKGTGHDYLGRSSAPYALSIWTHNILGLDFHDGFSPQGCHFSIDGPAISAAAGTRMLEIDYEAHLRNLTIVSGGAGTVGVGGYLTGGGHGALSSTYGLGADQVYEIEMVTPGGDIVTVNECQNTDLFWAMRGGGGSTFGVMTSITFRAFPSAEFIAALGIVLTPPGGEPYWDVVANILSQYDSLDAQHISAYTVVAPGYVNPTLGITTPLDVYLGSFNLQGLYPGNTSNSLAAALTAVFDAATAEYPGQFTVEVFPPTVYPDFWDWYSPNNGPLTGAGGDILVGSRLLDEKALSQNLTALKDALKIVTPTGSATGLYLVAGRGVANAKPRGGSNSVNPAWRKALVHTVTGVSWPPLDPVVQAQKENLLTNIYIEALSQLAPDMGAYQNEANPYEPNFQQSFWGDNYPRLLSIKRAVDPWDVFWGLASVGNERWEMVGDALCRV